MGAMWANQSAGQWGAQSPFVKTIAGEMGEVPLVGRGVTLPAPPPALASVAPASPSVAPAGTNAFAAAFGPATQGKSLLG
jgi:hypothetical protein